MILGCYASSDTVGPESLQGTKNLNTIKGFLTEMCCLLLESLVSLGLQQDNEPKNTAENSQEWLRKKTFLKCPSILLRNFRGS